MLLENISKLMDIDVANTRLLIAEFTSKYRHTWIKLNDNIVFLTEVSRDRLVDNEGNTYYLNNNISIEPVLPKTGYYFDNTHLYYITRTNKRQWLKSFSLGENYNILSLAGPENITIPQILGLKHEKETLIWKQLVFLFWKNIGKFIEHVTANEIINIIILDSGFKHLKKELEELWPQFKIYSDIEYQKLLEQKPKPVKRSVLKSSSNEFTL